MKMTILCCMFFFCFGCSSTNQVRQSETNQSTTSQIGQNQPRYELFLGPKRVSGDTSDWTRAQAIEHFRWYRSKNSTTAKARGYYEGVEIILEEKQNEEAKLGRIRWEE